MNKTLVKVGPAEKDIHVASLFLKGIPPDDAESRAHRISQLRASKHLFDIVKDYIQAEFNAASGARIADYSAGDWAAKQAHLNGLMEAYEKIWKLLP